MVPDANNTADVVVSRVSFRKLYIRRYLKNYDCQNLKVQFNVKLIKNNKLLKVDYYEKNEL